MCNITVFCLQHWHNTRSQDETTKMFTSNYLDILVYLLLVIFIFNSSIHRQLLQNINVGKKYARLLNIAIMADHDPYIYHIIQKDNFLLSLIYQFLNINLLKWWVTNFLLVNKFLKCIFLFPYIKFSTKCLCHVKIFSYVLAV